LTSLYHILMTLFQDIGLVAGVFMAIFCPQPNSEKV
jgi:hypothetical protein